MDKCFFIAWDFLWFAIDVHRYEQLLALGCSQKHYAANIAVITLTPLVRSKYKVDKEKSGDMLYYNLYYFDDESDIDVVSTAYVSEYDISSFE